MSHLIAVAYQAVTTTQPPPEIDEAGVVVPLVVGLCAVVVIAGIGLAMAASKAPKRSLIDPPAVFSLTDGWLTNLTGLSAAAVAVVASTDVADALLDEHTRIEMALVGLIAVAALGFAPLLLALLTRFDASVSEPATVTPTWVYVVASSLAAGAATAQLTSLGRAAGGLKQLSGMRQGLMGACVVMALFALVYAAVFIERTLGFAAQWPPPENAEAIEPMPWSLSL
jgi:hypothetical protein